MTDFEKNTLLNLLTMCSKELRENGAHVCGKPAPKEHIDAAIDNIKGLASFLVCFELGGEDE